MVNYQAFVSPAIEGNAERERIARQCALVSAAAKLERLGRGLIPIPRVLDEAERALEEHAMHALKGDADQNGGDTWAVYAHATRDPEKYPRTATYLRG